LAIQRPEQSLGLIHKIWMPWRGICKTQIGRLSISISACGSGLSDPSRARRRFEIDLAATT